MTDKKPTHVIVRPGIYRRFGGKLQQLKVGAQLTLSTDVGERMVKRGFAKAIESAPEIAADEPEPETEPETEPGTASEDVEKQEVSEDKPKRSYKKRKAKE